MRTAAERKRSLVKLSRAIQHAPQEVHDRWQREKKTHGGLNQLLQDWCADPSWGTVMQKERKRLATLKRYERKIIWKMESELKTMFSDDEYVQHLVSTKAKDPKMCRANPEAPNKPKWRQFGLYVDEVVDRICAICTSSF